jgi:hypothetical protein
MAECAVETCGRPGVVAVDRNAPPKWVVCRTCWMGLLGRGPYLVRAVWKGHMIERFIALQPHFEVEDDQGSVLQV